MENELKWDKTITAKRKLFEIDLKKIWDYKDLISLFVKRDFIVYYKQTILGPLWYLIQPLFSTIMYMFIFGNVADIGTEGVPQVLFYFSGTMLWTYFSESLLKISNVFVENKNIFGKVYFPRLLVPISTSIGFVIKLFIQFILFLILYVGYYLNGENIVVTWRVFLFPMIVLWIGVVAMGSGMIISALTTKYRDIAMVLSFFLQLFMYATPVVYPLSAVPEKLKFIFWINPLSTPIEYFRWCFFGVGSINLTNVVYSITMTTLLFWGGVLLFNKNEQTFIDFI